MTQTKPKRLPPSVRAAFNLANRRRKAWKEKPEHMEAIRQRATKAAKTVRERKHQLLVHRLRTLPAEIQTDQLRVLILDIYPKRFCFRSFTNRVRKHGLMSYDAILGVWVNHTLGFDSIGPAGRV